MKLNPTDIMKLCYGQIVIARGKHRQPVSRPECPNCKYADLKAYEAPCNKCKWDGDILTQFEPKQVKPTREATEQIIMDSMKQIRDAYKGYCDADIQSLYLCFTGGKIAFFNNFWKEDSDTPINKYEED